MSQWLLSGLKIFWPQRKELMAGQGPPTQTPNYPAIPQATTLNRGPNFCR